MTGKKAPEICKRVCTPLGIVKRLPSLSTPQSRALYPLFGSQPRCCGVIKFLDISTIVTWRPDSKRQEHFD